MLLSVANLKEAKAFASTPVQKSITWNGHELTFFVRPLSYQTAMGDLAARNGADPIAARLANSICDEQGKAVFTVADITGEANPEQGGLDGDLATALLAAVGEVQMVKKSQPSTT